MKTTFELKPQDRKSFGGKCRVEQENGISKLISYNTEVAEFNQENREVKVFNTQSATTVRHINAFLLHFGFKKATKKEIETNYNHFKTL